MISEQKKILNSFYIPVFFVMILWIVKIAENVTGTVLTEYGVFPRQIDGLIGVLTMPFIHANYQHLISNSIPLIILGSSLIYFYRQSAMKVFLLIYFLHSFWLWLGGRESYHIGASGLVYGLASFLFFSGIIRRHIQLMAISMLVVFLYGGMIWGIFPLFIGVSWEAHLAGSLAGVLCAWVYRKEGLQKPVYEWEDDDTIPEEVYMEVVRDEQTEEGNTDNANPGEKNKPPVAGMPVIVQYNFKPTEANKPPAENDKD
ncbi:MAG: rhomboid family intramembrane serine protease [Bacteroidota bacterium]